MRSSARGVTSSSTARAGGSSPSEATGRPVSISPPSEREQRRHRVGDRARAAHGDGPADRMREHHQQQGERPGPGAVSGRIEWAAFPARSARAGSSSNRRRVSPAAERRPSAANRAAGSGCRGGRSGGPSRTSSERRASRARAGRSALGRRGRRAPSRPPSRRPSGAARPRRRRRAGGPAAGRGAPRAGRAPRAAATTGTASRAQRVHRRAHVVEMPGQRELLGARAAADRRRALEHPHRAAGLGKRDRRRQPVRAGADDDRVELWVRHAGTAWPRTAWEPSPCTYPSGCPRCARRSPPSPTGGGGRRTPSRS